MIFCLIGESASGKSTIERHLMNIGISKIISYTTRPPRPNEVNGEDYHFVDIDTFNHLASRKFFSEMAKYRDWYYGLSLNGVDYKNRDFVLVATYEGYNQLLKEVGKENIVAIYIKVDERVRMKRLLDRGDDIDEIIRRIKSDRDQFNEIESRCDHVVENKDICTSVIDVYNIIKNSSNAK